MGVKYYKIAKCDICGMTEQFDPIYSLPEAWNKITDEQGFVRYECVCLACTRKIWNYIEEYKALHYKSEAEDK